MNLHAILAAGQAATTTAQEQSAGNSALLMLIQFGPIVLIVVLMYFYDTSAAQKAKRRAEDAQQYGAVGDEITTIGGICGRVLNIKEDSLVIETGADRNKMTIKKWAIQTVDTIHDPNDIVDDDDDDDDDDD